MKLPRTAKLMTLLMLALGVGSFSFSFVLATSVDTLPLYAQFREYRLDLQDPNANSSKFFSRSWNEHLIGWLLESKTPTRADLDTLRERYRFAQIVYIVHSYEVHSLDSTTARLDLIYRTLANPKPMTLTIIYVLDSGLWRIDKVQFDARPAHSQQPPSIVDKFESPRDEQ